MRVCPALYGRAKSYSLIRCLLAVLALSDAYDTVLSKNVAHLLGIKRPTVHHALEVLQEKGLIRKELYGDVRLTEEGRALAMELETQRDELSAVLQELFPLARGGREGGAAADQRAERRKHRQAARGLSGHAARGQIAQNLKGSPDLFRESLFVCRSTGRFCACTARAARRISA